MPAINKLMIPASLALALAGCCPPFFCPPEPNISHAIRDCASSDLLGASQIMYTGPVASRAGSRWVRLSSDLMVIGSSVDKIFPPKAPDSLFAAPPTGANCVLANSGKTDLGVDLGVDIKTLPITGSLKTKLGAVTKLSATVDGFQWEWVEFDEYNIALKKLPSDSPYRQPGAGRMTAIGMLKVKGYTATVDFANSADLGIKAGYSGPLPASLAGDVTAGATATITDDGKLELKIPGETYVAGVFRPVGAGGETESSTKTSSTVDKGWSVAVTGVQNRIP